ncbi:hypothetical protein LSTR_LSTR008328 [Laodelphax striatellus]|uniref:Hexosyltransferase n=1 Tax=Laodelphax striatellus TaxID=195883 RepID=A0A482XL16_LAOST|nr:hypothetical protein LSTR_LSTR008328 [Laodelphax striatellus]
MFRFIVSLCRQNIYFIVGVILGLGLSLLLTPLIDNDCLFSIQFSSEDRQILRVHKNDDYEPRINLAGKPQKAQKTPQTLIRPRYFSTELGIKDKLFIGVLTRSETISSHAVALNKTVAHLVDKIMYFIDAPSAQRLNVSSLKLPGIVGFTDTRDILKPFHLLKYLTDNFLEEYDFFFISKDTTYIRARNLYDFVKKVSVSEEVYAGTETAEQSGFCSLDAGILLSNSVLKKIQTNLEWCVKSAYSDNDSDNIGRCVLHATKIPCRSTVQGQLINSFHLSNINIDVEDKEILKNPKFEGSLTFYPVKQPTTFYKLHLYFCKIAMMHEKLEISNLRRSLVNMSYVAPGGRDSVTWPVGSQPGNKPVNRFDVLRWDYFTQTHIYLANDFSNIRSLTGAEKIDVQYVLNSSISHMEDKYEGLIHYKRLINGYRRFDPSRGMDYILDLAFKDNTNGKEVHKRVEICKPLGKVELLPIPYVTENTRVNFILPVDAAHKNEAVKFIQQYTKVCMEKKDKTFLMLVFLYDANVPGKGNSDDIFKEIKENAVALSNRFQKDGSKIAWLSIKLPSLSSQYTSVHQALLDFAIADLALKKFPAESLMLFCQTNMDIKQDYLNRVRMNTIIQWQIFSPVPYTEFNPAIVYGPETARPADLDINKNVGHFDSHNTKHISFYNEDYATARKALESTIPMVKNDKDILNLFQNQAANLTHYAVHTLYSMFVRKSNVHVLRGVEPSLRLRYEEKSCPVDNQSSPSATSTGLYNDCILTRSLNLGTRSQLAKLILDYQVTAHQIKR